MSSSGIEEELKHEFDWRIKEISVLKTFQYFQKLRDYHKNIYLKYSFVALYALWEGFVNSCFSLYIQELNRMSLSYNQIYIPIITNDLDAKFNLRNQRDNFQTRCELIENLHEYMSNPVMLSINIPTKSNINFKIINNILKIFNMKELNSSNLRLGLDKIVVIRNNIAHGEFTIPVDRDLFNESCQIVIELMTEIIERILDAYKNQTFLRIS